MLTIGVIVAANRFWHPASALQVVGAAALLTAAVMSWLPLAHFQARRIAPAGVWRLQEAISAGGLLLFAAEYCWYWLVVSGRGDSL